MTTVRELGDKVPARYPSWMKDAGVEIYSTCTRFLYPKNGNVFNPTPVLFWIAQYQGRIIARGQKLGAVKEVVQDFLKNEV